MLSGQEMIEIGSGVLNFFLRCFYKVLKTIMSR